MAKAIVVGTDARVTLLANTSRELTEGLRELGHDVELGLIPDLRAAEEYEKLCNKIQRAIDDFDDFFLVDMNCHLKYSGVTRTGMRRFSYVTDAPWSLFQSIYTVPNDTTISYVDRNHAQFYARFPTGRPTVFMPHGGPLPDDTWHEERPVDVLFLGNLQTPCLMEHLGRVTAELPAPLGRVAGVSVDLILEEGMEPFQAVQNGLAAFGLSIEAVGPQPLIKLLRIICPFVESYNRHRTLTSLGKVKVVIAGSIAPDFFDKQPHNVSALGIVDEQAAMALMRRSRILLNSVTVFPGGSHERVWYGMACGAAICADESDFIKETLTYGTHLLSLEDAIASGGETLADHLARTKGVVETAHAAREIYAAHHTWRHRARIISRAMGYG
ncbi:MAG: glycosyltransferase family 1 protein [Rhodospirillaceae bacterium]|nr:glycosyltransferase family 1 protein [Rhodospirillales bacterium]